MRTKAACENCKYWGELSSPAECRKHSPTPVAGYQWGQWPLTQPNDWCGDHEYRPCEHVWDKQWIVDHSKPDQRLPCCSKCHAVLGVDA
jgi:hypothetical protein